MASLFGRARSPLWQVDFYYKRSISLYHQVGVKMDELEHRFNNRKNEYIFRDTLTKLVRAAKLPYSE